MLPPLLIAHVYGCTKRGVHCAFAASPTIVSDAYICCWFHPNTHFAVLVSMARPKKNKMMKKSSIPDPCFPMTTYLIKLRSVIVDLITNEISKLYAPFIDSRNQ